MKTMVASSLVAAASAEHTMRWVPNPEFVWDVSGSALPGQPKPLGLWKHRDVNNIDTNEKFIVTQLFDDKFAIKWVHKDDALGELCVEAGSLDNGAVIQLNTCNAGPLQEWKGASIIGLKDGVIRNGGTNKCIDVEYDVDKDGEQVPDGANLQVWDCNDSGNQNWRLDRPDAPEPVPPLPPVPPSPGPSDKCGACINSANHCFRALGYTEDQCRCQNNDASCGNDWYMWVCKGSSGTTAWISDDCSKCNGDNNGPCLPPFNMTTIV